VRVRSSDDRPKEDVGHESGLAVADLLVVNTTTHDEFCQQLAERTLDIATEAADSSVPIDPAMRSRWSATSPVRPHPCSLVAQNDQHAALPKGPRFKEDQIPHAARVNN